MIMTRQPRSFERDGLDATAGSSLLYILLARTGAFGGVDFDCFRSTDGPSTRTRGLIWSLARF